MNGIDDLWRVPEIQKLMRDKSFKREWKKFYLKFTSQTIVNTKSYTCHFLRDNHQWSSNVERIRTIVIVLAMKVNTR